MKKKRFLQSFSCPNYRRISVLVQFTIKVVVPLELAYFERVFGREHKKGFSTEINVCKRFLTKINDFQLYNTEINVERLLFYFIN